MAVGHCKTGETRQQSTAAVASGGECVGPSGSNIEACETEEAVGETEPDQGGSEAGAVFGLPELAISAHKHIRRRTASEGERMVAGSAQAEPWQNDKPVQTKPEMQAAETG